MGRLWIAGCAPEVASGVLGAGIAVSAAQPGDDPAYDVFTAVASGVDARSWPATAEALTGVASGLVLEEGGAVVATHGPPRPRLAWSAGAVVPLAQVSLPVTDIQVTHGLGVYETLEAGVDARGRASPDPGPNLARLAESARAIGVVPPPDAELVGRIEAIAAAVGGVAWVRINLSGDGACIVWGEAVDPLRRHRSVRCGRAPHVDHPLLAGAVKHRSRGPWVAELRRRGDVDELLFVDAHRRFTEGTSCAVVAVRAGAVWTAPWDGRILRSTTLERILTRADRLQIPVVRWGSPADGPWDALYVASTTRDLAPVTVLDGVALPGWDPVGRALARAR